MDMEIWEFYHFLSDAWRRSGVEPSANSWASRTHVPLYPEV